MFWTNPCDHKPMRPDCRTNPKYDEQHRTIYFVGCGTWGNRKEEILMYIYLDPRTTFVFWGHSKEWHSLKTGLFFDKAHFF